MIVEFGTILLNIILPIFLILGIGVIFDRAFKPDLDTMSKLNFYLLLPAIVFISVVDAELSIGSFFSVAGFYLLFIAVLLGISLGLYSFRKFREKRSIMTLGTIFYNAGNFGLPFTVFAFGEEYLDIITVIIIVQNVLTFTIGILLMEWGMETNVKAILKRILKIPVIYALIAGYLFRLIGVAVPAQLYNPINYISSAMVAMALLTLSFKLSRVKIFQIKFSAIVVIITRLIISPILAFLLVQLFQFDPDIESMLIIVSGLPTAVNTYIMAAEYKRDEDIASQVVFWTTILSVFTLSILLFIFS